MIKDNIPTLIDEANSFRVQKHQVSESQNKLSEIDMILKNIEKEQRQDDNKLDKMIIEMENLFLNKKENHDLSEIDVFLLTIESEKDLPSSKKKLKLVEEIVAIEYNDNMSWDIYHNSVEQYALKNNINLAEDPFKHIMTKSQQVELQKRIQEEFTYKNAKCDKYDYMIASTCGVIAGLIDILFVGIPGDSKLGNFTDEQANKITEKFAVLLGWNKNKAIERGSNTTASAIGFLENKFKINYDHATTHATGGAVENLSLKNHHLKSLGHSPDIIGLFFSVLNQFTNTSSFISNGQLITINTESFELQGNNFISKLFCGVANWFGHIMSDWTGSSGTVGQGGRGTGVPIPFYSLFQLLNVGEFGQHRQTFATITTKVFEQGYDARHGLTMAIPVVINELSIRFMYTMKARFYHEKTWNDSTPKASNPELRRMLLVGHGVLSLIDVVDATIRSNGDIIQFLLRSNLIAWTQLGHLALKEVYASWNEGKIDIERVDEYLDKELRKMSL